MACKLTYDQKDGHIYEVLYRVDSDGDKLSHGVWIEVPELKGIRFSYNHAHRVCNTLDKVRRKGWNNAISAVKDLAESNKEKEV